MANQSGSAAANGLTALTSPALDFVFMRPSRIGVQSAWYGHVPFAQWLVANTAPRVIVELGSHNGVSYAAFCEAAVRAGLPVRCAAIDTWQGDEHAGFYGDDVYHDLKRFHDPRYGGFSTMMRMTFDAARPFFADGSLDLLHIDGLHTYEAVRHDWETWRTALSDRAVVLFHDVNERQGDFGVWRLWDELRAEYPSFTFLHSHGLGVLAVGTSVPEAVLQLCAAEKDAAQCGRLRERFAQLGERWDSHFEQTDALQRRQAAGKRSASLSAELAATQTRITGEYEARTGAACTRIWKKRGASATPPGPTRTCWKTSSAASRPSSTKPMRDLAQRAEDWERVHRHLAVREAAIEQAQAEAGRRPRAGCQHRILAHLAGRGAGARGSATPCRGCPVPRGAPPSSPGLRCPANWGRAGPCASNARPTSRRCATPGCSTPRSTCPATRTWPPPSTTRSRITFGSAPRRVRCPTRISTARGMPPSHPEIAASGENPLLHWIRSGAAAGFDPNPFLDAAWYVARNPERAARSRCCTISRPGRNRRSTRTRCWMPRHTCWSTPHARQSGLDALRHWWVFGAGMALDPHPLFDVAWYRREHRTAGGGRPAGALAADRAARRGWQPRRTASRRISPSRSPPKPTPRPRSSSRRTATRSTRSAPCGRSPPTRAGSTGSRCWSPTTIRSAAIAPLLQRRVAGLRTVENPTNLGFLRSCNNAAQLAAGRVLVFLNNDTAVHEDWLAPLLALMARHADIGMVGCKMLNKDGTLQEAGVAIPSNGWGMPYGAGDDPALAVLQLRARRGCRRWRLHRRAAGRMGRGGRLRRRLRPGVLRGVRPCLRTAQPWLARGVSAGQRRDPWRQQLLRRRDARPAEQQEPRPVLPQMGQRAGHPAAGRCVPASPAAAPARWEGRAVHR